MSLQDDDCPNSIDAATVYFLLKELKETVLNIDHKLNGNGQPGLMQRVTIVETEAVEMKNQLKELKPSGFWKQVGVLVASTIFATLIIWGGSTLYKSDIHQSIPQQITPITQVRK